MRTLVIVTVCALMASLLGSTASAQECVTCRSDRCSGMFWISPCAAGAGPRAEPHRPRAPTSPCGAAGLELAVDFPPRVEEDDLLGIRIRTTCDAWLVVYYLEQSGPGAILWPSRLEPEPTSTPTHPASVLSAREVAAHQMLVAKLAKPGVPSQEEFVVYAFADRADFERLKPRRRDDARAYAAQLQRNLQSLKPGRWASFTARYTITPR